MTSAFSPVPHTVYRFGFTFPEMRNLPDCCLGTDGSKVQLFHKDDLRFHRNWLIQRESNGAYTISISVCGSFLCLKRIGQSIVVGRDDGASANKWWNLQKTHDGKIIFVAYDEEHKLKECIGVVGVLNSLAMVPFNFSDCSNNSFSVSDLGTLTSLFEGVHVVRAVGIPEPNIPRETDSSGNEIGEPALAVDVLSFTSDYVKLTDDRAHKWNVFRYANNTFSFSVYSKDNSFITSYNDQTFKLEAKDNSQSQMFSIISSPYRNFQIIFHSKTNQTLYLTHKDSALSLAPDSHNDPENQNWDLQRFTMFSQPYYGLDNISVYTLGIGNGLLTRNKEGRELVSLEESKDPLYFLLQTWIISPVEGEMDTFCIKTRGKESNTFEYLGCSSEYTPCLCAEDEGNGYQRWRVTRDNDKNKIVLKAQPHGVDLYLVVEDDNKLAFTTFPRDKTTEIWNLNKIKKPKRWYLRSCFFYGVFLQLMISCFLTGLVMLGLGCNPLTRSCVSYHHHDSVVIVNRIYTDEVSSSDDDGTTTVFKVDVQFQYNGVFVALDFPNQYIPDSIPTTDPMVVYVGGERCRYYSNSFAQKSKARADANQFAKAGENQKVLGLRTRKQICPLTAKTGFMYWQIGATLLMFSIFSSVIYFTHNSFLKWHHFNPRGNMVTWFKSKFCCVTKQIENKSIVSVKEVQLSSV